MTNSNLAKAATVVPGPLGTIALGLGLYYHGTGNTQQRFGVRRKNPQGNQTG